MSKTCVYIFRGDEARLWGLSGRERLSRMLGRYDGMEIVSELPELHADNTILLMRGDYLFDSRLLQPLLQLEKKIALYTDDGGQLVATKTQAGNARALLAEFTGESKLDLIAGIPPSRPGDLVPAYDPQLLKYDPPKILAITRENTRELESELFDGSYKGVTDFVTKWIWPLPARAAVRFCVNSRISPNQVTLLSILLALFAGLAFWAGFLLTGLLLGWFMTFLDTVDGKLARVTVTSSKTGDVLDHGLDLIHPPLWYLAWALGITGTWISNATAMTLFWIILFAYIGGRLCEGAFELWIAKFRLFLWQPLDSYNRLVTARRNPNLVILSISLMFGRPDTGIYLVATWHVISTLVLMLRLYMAWREKQLHGELSTWLNTIDPEQDENRLEVKLFTRFSKPSPDRTGKTTF